MRQRQAKTAAAARPLRIDGRATGERAAELSVLLAAAIGGGRGRVELDVSGVSAIDAVGVQLFLGAQIAATANDVELVLQGADGPFRDAFAGFGLERYIAG